MMTAGGSFSVLSCLDWQFNGKRLFKPWRSRFFHVFSKCSSFVSFKEAAGLALILLSQEELARDRMACA